MAEMFSPYGAEAGEIDRRQKYAELLRQQSMEPLQSQSAGGYVIPTSPFQGMAKLLQAYTANKVNDNAINQRNSLIGRMDTERSKTMEEFARQLRGEPARPAVLDPQESQQANDYGTPSSYTVPAVAGDRGAAFNTLMQSKDPMLRQLGLQQTIEMAKPKAPIRQDVGDRILLLDANTGAEIGSIPKGATPDTTVKEGGLDRRFAGVSGNTAATVNAANQRHLTPSGSAVLSANTTLQTHATPSGSAKLSAETARRGQDMDIDPNIQQSVAQARARGKEFGEAGAQAEINLPTVTSKGRQAIELIDQMIGTEGKQLKPTDKKVAPHPGFSSYVGATLVPGARFVEGSETANYEALQKQLTGGAFLQAFESLKGGGQITQIEGEKATNAITRMSKAQSEADYVKAAREFQDVIRKGVERAEKNATRYNGPERRGTGGTVLRFDANGNPI